MTSQPFKEATPFSTIADFSLGFRPLGYRAQRGFVQLQFVENPPRFRVGLDIAAERVYRQGKAEEGAVAKKRLIYVFKVQLRDVEPAVWRRIAVPEQSSFWDLPVAIQDAIGWLDCPLHEFILADKQLGKVSFAGIPDPDGNSERKTLEGWALPMAHYFSHINRHAEYFYDFGDGWEHDVLLKSIEACPPRKRLPACLDGANACPPEDCGGPHRYRYLLDVLADPQHEEHEMIKEWIGGNVDPAKFSARAVKFDNPKRRWEGAFGEPASDDSNAVGDPGLN